MELCCHCRACLLVVQKWSKFSSTLCERNLMSDEQVSDLVIFAINVKMESN